MKPVYVWTLPTRVFHWLFVSLIITAWISSEEDRWMNIHVAIGSSIAVLLLYRLAWGIIGPKYSRFSDFEFRIDALKVYLLALFASSRRYTGHNPAASYVMIAMLIAVSLAVLTGFLAYGIQENRGLLAFLHNSRYREMELFVELHEISVNAMWVFIAAHIGGVLLDRWLHPTDRTMTSIIDGYKQCEGEDVSLNILQKTVAFAGITATIAVLVYILITPQNPLTASHTPYINYAKEHPVFANECGSCHTLYPPSLLPKQSWKKLMGNLENHFGDDASLDSADQQSILAYLIKHSAESSNQEMSVKMMQTLKNRDIIAITHTLFWKETHRDISTDVFLRDSIKSRANCKACHRDIEQGTIQDNEIKPMQRGKR